MAAPPLTGLLATRWGRLLTFSLLYLSEGIPFGFSAIALTVYLRQSGASIAEVGAFTGSLYAPWGFKWAWAPVVDLIRVRRFGHRRFWIITAQTLMILTLGLIVFFDVSGKIGLLTLLIIIHNVFAATQDVAIDGLAVTVLPKDELGTANGFMFGSQYFGQAIGGAGALFVVAQFGWRAAFPFVCGLLIAILAFVVFVLKEPDLDEPASTSREPSFIPALKTRLTEFFRELGKGFFRSGSGPLVGVVVALLPVGAIALGLGLGSTLQVDLKMSDGEIASLSFWSAILAAAGCVLGGWIADRVGQRLSLAVWVILSTIPTFLLAAEFTGGGVEGVTISEYWRWSLIYSFATGLTNASSIAIYMGLTSTAVASTQFTGYMAMKNLVYTYSSNWQGYLAQNRGYALPLRLDCLAALIPVLFYPWLKPAKRKNS